MSAEDLREQDQSVEAEILPSSPSALRKKDPSIRKCLPAMSPASARRSDLPLLDHLVIIVMCSPKAEVLILADQFYKMLMKLFLVLHLMLHRPRMEAFTKM